MLSKKIAILNLSEFLSRKGDIGLDQSGHTSTTAGSSVSFNETIEFVVPTIRRVDYSDEERRATWYDSLEFRSIKTERRRLVKLMEKGEPIDDGDARGLEAKTREGNRRRQMAILNAVSAVLDEQEDQIVRCSADPDALAYIYRMYTKRSEDLAVERARDDQAEAALVYC